jgi:REP element-mobilizing transposase RayT
MPYDPQKHHCRSIRLKDYDYTQPGAYFVTLVTYQRESLFGQIVGGKIQLTPLGEIVQQEWTRSTQLRREIELNDQEFVIMPNHLHGIVWLLHPAASNPFVGADGVRPMTVDPGARGAPQPYRDDDGIARDDTDNVGADGIRPGNAVRLDGVRPTTVDPGARGAPQPYRDDDGIARDDADDVWADGIHPGNAVRPMDGVRPMTVDPGARGAPQPYRDDDGVARDDADDVGADGTRPAPRRIRREAQSLASFVAGFKASVTSRARRELDAWNIWQRNYYEHIIRNEAELAQIRIYIQTNPLRWDADQLHPSAPPNRFNQE